MAAGRSWSRAAGYEEIIVKEVETAGKVKATNVHPRRHGGAAPYGRAASPSPRPIRKRHNDALTSHMTTNGFDIVRAEGMDLPFKEMQNLPPADIATFAGAVLAAAPDCDALYLPCPQWQAAQTVDELERASGKPVIAYTHACFFVAFRTMGLNDAIRGHGRLLASLAKPS